MTLPQETIKVIKTNAESYAGVMVWVNQTPKGEEQLFYEYIAATSHQAGATEWAGKVQELVDALEWCSAFGKDNPEEMKKYIDLILAKYKEVSNV